jgi:hypothetical protein
VASRSGGGDRVGGNRGRWGMDANVGAGPGGARARLAMGTMVVASWPYYGGRAAPGRSVCWSRTGDPDNGGPDGGWAGRLNGGRV